MRQLMVRTYITGEAKAWLKRYDGSGEVIRVVPAYAPIGHQCYELYPAYENCEGHIGRVLFDVQGYWIYDGSDLDIAEQEQVAAFIIHYVERD
jgi:hypothetical protein